MINEVLDTLRILGFENPCYSDGSFQFANPSDEDLDDAVIKILKEAKENGRIKDFDVHSVTVVDCGDLKCGAVAFAYILHDNEMFVYNIPWCIEYC